MADEEAGTKPDFEEPEGKGALKPINETTPLEKLVLVVAVAAVGTAVGAIVVAGANSVVMVAGILSCVTGPYMYMQQTQITDIKALKDTQEAAKREVDRLEIENDRLKQSVAQLTETVGKLEDVEQALDAITEVQGQSVATFMNQVEESKQILEKLEENHKCIVLQNIIDVIYRCDEDGSGHINNSEIDTLIAKFKGINGVEVEEGKFRSAIVGSGGSLNAVLDIVKNLLNEEEDEDQIFTIVSKK